MNVELTDLVEGIKKTAVFSLAEPTKEAHKLAFNNDAREWEEAYFAPLKNYDVVFVSICFFSKTDTRCKKSFHVETKKAREIWLQLKSIGMIQIW